MALVAYYSFQNKVVQVFSVLLVAGAGSLVQMGLMTVLVLLMTALVLLVLLLVLVVLVGLVLLVLLLVLVGLVHLLVLLVLLALLALLVLLVLVVLVQVGLEVASNYLLLLDLELLVSALLDRKLWCKTEIKINEVACRAIPGPGSTKSCSLNCFSISSNLGFA